MVGWLVEGSFDEIGWLVGWLAEGSFGEIGWLVEGLFSEISSLVKYPTGSLCHFKGL